MLTRRLAGPAHRYALHRHITAAQPSTSSIHTRKIATKANAIRTQPASRSTLSSIWTPTGGVSATDNESGHGKLIRAGYLRQSHSGIFQMLPLGLRVQQKIENLLDYHMQTLGASRLSLSTITTEGLWRKSGRLDAVASELFRLNDRKNVKLMLSPTHEEEITTLVANTLTSYKDLPLRLYQTTRKYRDEIRPRHGLLRSREFLMKDLYTFDISYESAIEGYKKVSDAYRAFFSDLKLPVIVAEASSGDMGGTYSHEYHLANVIGEDTVATCDTCGYAANDEVAITRPSTTRFNNSLTEDIKPSSFRVWRGITKDRKYLVNAWYPHTQNATEEDLNIHAVKAVVPGLDTSIADALYLWGEALRRVPEDGSEAVQILNVVDSTLSPVFEKLRSELPLAPSPLDASSLKQSSITTGPMGSELTLLRLENGDDCPRCDSGSLQLHRALELGHTFHLGTRYSEPLEAYVTIPQQPEKKLPLQMGCYGIGVSRILGAVAEHRADKRGLNWPRSISPYEVVIVPTSGVDHDILDFYDMLATPTSTKKGIDVVLDDRKVSFGWKMQDADMTGYPVTIILGKAWREQGICEVQCRSISLNEKVPKESVLGYLEVLLEKL